MENFQGRIISQLPNMGTSIFAVMTQMAIKHNALNLSQGFPDFPVSEKLIDLIHYFMKKGMNQYAPMPGVSVLRQEISKKVKKIYGVKYNPDKEINIVAGATQAIYTIISAFIRDEDEAIILEPAYDSYAPAIRLNGGVVKYAQLQLPDYSINWEQLSRMVTHRTRLIIINTPHNPTGSVLREDDMKRLDMLTRQRDIVILSDEVYEHLIYNGLEHQSICRFPELAKRSFIVGSFGKTFHATGWKMGYTLAPENLMAEFRKAHQFVVFACNTPVQYAIAEYLKDENNYNGLANFYEKKRNYFTRKLNGSRFKIIPSFGTYFQLLDYSDVSDKNEMEFAEWLIKKHGIASVPISPFYQNKTETKRLRFCFAKKEETLDKATEILCRI